MIGAVVVSSPGDAVVVDPQLSSASLGVWTVLFSLDFQDVDVPVQVNVNIISVSLT